MDIENLQQEFLFVSTKAEQIILMNNYLKKDLRRQTVKIEKQHERMIEDLKKELRKRKEENRDLQHQLECENLSKQKYIDEIRYLQNNLRKVKPVAELLRKFKAHIIEFNKKKMESALLIINNGKFMMENKNLSIAENINQVFVFELGLNELHYVSEKKRALVVKLCITSDRERSLTIASSTKSQDEILIELEREKKILEAINKMYPLLKPAEQEKANEQKKGSLLLIEQLQLDLQTAPKGIKQKNKINYFEFNNHRFLKTTLIQNAICHRCSSLFYGYSNQGLECVECKMVVHETCKTLIAESCELFSALKRGQVYFVMLGSIEEKERFVKCFY